MVIVFVDYIGIRFPGLLKGFYFDDKAMAEVTIMKIFTDTDNFGFN